jgi:hypothetical protein
VLAGELSQPAAASPDTSNYIGYNPKIHGDYDPNADYAQYHNQRRREELGIVDPYQPDTVPAVGSNDYAAALALNRFTGHAQPTHLSAERHSDVAKSSRQLGAFFDVDAAANAHDGRSLKQERQQKKLTKEQIKAYNEHRKEKKKNKRLQFYKS